MVRFGSRDRDISLPLQFPEGPLFLLPACQPLQGAPLRAAIRFFFMHGQVIANQRVHTSIDGVFRLERVGYQGMGRERAYRYPRRLGLETNVAGWSLILWGCCFWESTVPLCGLPSAEIGCLEEGLAPAAAPVQSTVPPPAARHQYHQQQPRYIDSVTAPPLTTMRRSRLFFFLSFALSVFLSFLSVFLSVF